MVEKDRYSGDEIQQASAIIAAVREVALMLIEQHLEAGASVAAGSQRKPAVEEMRAVLQLALACPDVGQT
jgi:DNA-binding FrmR family transcriptional regulator